MLCRRSNRVSNAERAAPIDEVIRACPRCIPGGMGRCQTRRSVLLVPLPAGAEIGYSALPGTFLDPASFGGAHSRIRSGVGSASADLTTNEDVSNQGDSRERHLVRRNKPGRLRAYAAEMR